ncbi:MAG: DUF2958 domain-containing protein [Chloroflexota bacterium]
MITIKRTSLLGELNLLVGDNKRLRDAAQILEKPVKGRMGAIFKYDHIIQYLMELGMKWPEADKRIRRLVKDRGKISWVGPPDVSIFQRGLHLIIPFRELGLCERASTKISKNQDALKMIPQDLPIPKLYGTEDQKDYEKLVWVKLFTPRSNWTWWITEYNPHTQIAFGLVDGFEREWGYISIQEIDEMNAAFCSVERDLHFNPITYGELVSKESGDHQYIIKMMREWKFSTKKKK